MKYNILSDKKLHFIVTPDELREILKGFHYVVTDKGVRKNYTESEPCDFLGKYDELYDKLKNGDRLIRENDFGIVNFSTGLTAHLENCIYHPTSRLSVPDFSEPCPYIDTFCICPFNDKLSTSFSVMQFPENVCGLCLHFPLRIEYENETEKHAVGLVDGRELEDFSTYEILTNRINSFTKPMKLNFNGSVRRTSVRISDNAKTEFDNFYFAYSNNITII